MVWKIIIKLRVLVIHIPISHLWNWEIGICCLFNKRAISPLYVRTVTVDHTWLGVFAHPLEKNGRQAANIETSMNQWMNQLPPHLFKSIIFDCGKEFSNWKSISNKQDIDIYFADPGTSSQRGLNEHSNGLLRKNGLPKEMDFNPVSQDYISDAARKRNNIPRKSLNYQIPIECFMGDVGQDFQESMLSRLIWQSKP